MAEHVTFYFQRGAATPSTASAYAERGLLHNMHVYADDVARFRFSMPRAHLDSAADRQACLSALMDLYKRTEGDIVAFGGCGGANALLCTIAKLARDSKSSNFAKELLSRVKLVVLEAPYDSVESLLEVGHWFGSHQSALLALLGSYDASERSALEFARDFPKHIPVAFVVSLRDGRVPLVCSSRLVSELRQLGHRQVSTILLTDAPHAQYATHNARDTDAYRSALDELRATHCT